MDGGTGFVLDGINIDGDSIKYVMDQVLGTTRAALLNRRDNPGNDLTNQAFS
jgi:hypothetical protein